MEHKTNQFKMLLSDFYTIEKIENVAEGKYSAFVFLNREHAVFKGHFPGNPVLPGVCTMQIIKELTQEIVGHSLVLSSASNVKFMALINPDINPSLKMELEISEQENGEVKVKNTTYFEDTLALKLVNNYQKN